MSATSLVDITPPAEAFLATAQKYKNKIHETIDAQTNTKAITKLDLPEIYREVEDEYIKNHHNEVI
jgi:hypothetical protein